MCITLLCTCTRTSALAYTCMYSEVWWRWSGQRLVEETSIELDIEERYPPGPCIARIDRWWVGYCVLWYHVVHVHGYICMWPSYSLARLYRHGQVTRPSGVFSIGYGMRPSHILQCCSHTSLTTDMGPVQGIIHVLCGAHSIISYLFLCIHVHVGWFAMYCTGIWRTLLSWAPANPG